MRMEAFSYNTVAQLTIAVMHNKRSMKTSVAKDIEPDLFKEGKK